MQAIKCVVVGDGYALFHFEFIRCRFVQLQLWIQDMLTGVMHDGDGWPPCGGSLGLFDRKIND